MSFVEAGYVFALCNPGSEKALKLEVETTVAGWRPSYQRRGFVTFKPDVPASPNHPPPELACARRLCVSLGKSTTREEALATLRSAAPELAAIHHARFHERKMQGLPPATPAAAPTPGDLIGTVVELGPAEFWAGLHRHARFASPDPAGDSGSVMPADSPSRAWLKLEEAVRFFGLEFTPQDIAVELGCAPGGVALALLRRGVSVIGVDPAAMAEVVRAAAIDQREAAPADRPWFFHVRKPAALTAKRDLGQGVTWFMSDMNQAPEIVLKECARFCRMAPTIRGVLITLKVTDLMQIADKRAWLAALADMGFQTRRLQQLSVHHREFALLGLRTE
jgi:23S rRNA (cytidine2498-2'-O)-methyltransferase